MVMATISLLRRLPNPTDQDISRVMDRNVCRCGTYYSGSLDQRQPLTRSHKVKRPEDSKTSVAVVRLGADMVIQWRMHIKVPPERVFATLDSNDGRASFW